MEDHSNSIDADLKPSIPSPSTDSVGTHHSNEANHTENAELKASASPPNGTKGMETYSNEKRSPENQALRSPNTILTVEEMVKNITGFNADYKDLNLDQSDHIGTIPVDIHGRPIENLSKTGGWLAACFIFGNEMTERMAYFGIAVNLVFFLLYEMHLSYTSAANAVINFMGISQASSIIGGFLADAYLGRYRTISIFINIYLLGLAGLTVCGAVKKFIPPPCTMGKDICIEAKSWQTSYFYTALYVSACGAAGIRPCVSAFGADQFDERDPDYKPKLDRFFNFFYLFVTTGAILSLTLIVYIQSALGWGAAFGSLAISMAISNIIFFAGTPIYRHRLPGGSPLTRIAQVVVAAFHKRNVAVPQDENQLYEVSGKQSAVKGSGKLKHTHEFRLLDKAAVRTEEPDDADVNPWRLCTITQVEEVKLLLKVLPIWATTILLSTVLSAFITTSVPQAQTLNRHLGNLNMPATSMPVFPCVLIFVALAVYDTWFVPLARRLTGHPRGTTHLQRIGVGLGMSIVSVVWAGAFERYRRTYALRHGFESRPLDSMPHLSAFWLVIQFSLIGLAEVFAAVGMLEFFYSEAPDAMRSLGISFSATAGGLGCFVGSILNNVIDSVTSRHGRISWLFANINMGRYDNVYWFYAILTAANLCLFLFFASRYKYRDRNHNNSTDDAESLYKCPAPLKS